MLDPQHPDDGIPRTELLDVEQLRRLREDNPAALYRHLRSMCQRFAFGVERCEGWGGAFRILLNRNLSLHLAHGFDEDMPDQSYLPQFCALPSDDQADTSEGTSIRIEGEEIRGLIFRVDPFDFDELLRDAGRIAEEYPEWDVVPDSYFLDTTLVQWIARVVLDEPRIAAEREFDFRLGFPGLRPEPLEEEEALSAEDLIAQEGDDEEPMTGMRTVTAEWG